VGKALRKAPKLVEISAGRELTTASPSLIFLIAAFRPLRFWDVLWKAIGFYHKVGTVAIALDDSQPEEIEKLTAEIEARLSLPGYPILLYPAKERLLWTRLNFQFALQEVNELEIAKVILFVNQDVRFDTEEAFLVTLNRLLTPLSVPEIGITCPLRLALPWRQNFGFWLAKDWLVPYEGCVPFCFAAVKGELVRLLAPQICSPAHYASDDLFCWKAILDFNQLPLFVSACPGPEHRASSVLASEPKADSIRRLLQTTAVVERAYFDEIRRNALLKLTSLREQVGSRLASSG